MGPKLARVAVIGGVALCSSWACVTQARHWEGPRAEPALPAFPSMVSVGATWSCAVLRDLSLACWGWHERRKHLSIAGLDSSPTAMVVASDRACFADRRGALWCDGGALKFHDVWHFDARGAWVCASLRCGGVLCSNGGAIEPVAGLDFYVDEVYVRADGIAVALVHDQVYTWQLEELGSGVRRVEDLDPWTAYVAIRTCQSGEIESCANIGSQLIEPLRALRGVALGSAFGCGLDEDDRVWCTWFGAEQSIAVATTFFGVDAERLERGVLYLITSMADLRARSVDVSDDHACAIDQLGGVRCWGQNTECKAMAPAYCGELTIEPTYEGVDLEIPAEHVRAAQTETYVVPVDERSEVRLTITGEQFERLGVGEVIEVQASFVWMQGGAERTHERKLAYTLECRPEQPPTSAGGCYSSGL